MFSVLCPTMTNGDSSLFSPKHKKYLVYFRNIIRNIIRNIFVT